MQKSTKYCILLHSHFIFFTSFSYKCILIKRVHLVFCVIFAHPLYKKKKSFIFSEILIHHLWLNINPYLSANCKSSQKKKTQVQASVMRASPCCCHFPHSYAHNVNLEFEFRSNGQKDKIINIGIHAVLILSIWSYESSFFQKAHSNRIDAKNLAFSDKRGVRSLGH